MTGYFPQEMFEHRSRLRLLGNTQEQLDSFTEAVMSLSPTAKQAMLAAASHGLIMRGTWDGCAFNKAGEEVQSYIKKTGVAAQTFGMSQDDVDNFITRWDGLHGTDEECTKLLVMALEGVGLFTEVGEIKHAQVYRHRVYTSWETRMREEFDQLNEQGAVPFMAEAVELLSVGA